MLWTDDQVLAATARNELKTRTCGTQAALQALTEIGLLAEDRYLEGSAKLLGWDYRATAFGVPVLAKAGELAEWNPERYPFKQALDVFGLESIPIANAVGLAAGLMSRAYREIPLPERRQAFTVRVLERLSSRSQGAAALRALRNLLVVSFGLNVVGAHDVVQVIDAWLAVRYLPNGTPDTSKPSLGRGLPTTPGECAFKPRSVRG
jgi:hypothetical protein